MGKICGFVISTYLRIEWCWVILIDKAKSEEQVL